MSTIEHMLSSINTKTKIIIERLMPGDRLSPQKAEGEWWEISTPEFVDIDEANEWISEENARTHAAIGRTFTHCVSVRTVTTVTTAIKIIDE